MPAPTTTLAIGEHVACPYPGATGGGAWPFLVCGWLRRAPHYLCKLQCVTVTWRVHSEARVRIHRRKYTLVSRDLNLMVDGAGDWLTTFLATQHRDSQVAVGLTLTQQCTPICKLVPSTVALYHARSTCWRRRQVAYVCFTTGGWWRLRDHISRKFTRVTSFVAPFLFHHLRF